MPKYYKKKSGSRDKYSVEQTAGALSIPAVSQGYTQVVPDTAIGGMRKVKHLTISASIPSSSASSTAAYWALVYVPQGTAVGSLNLSGSNLYEPNQFVMNCGTFDGDAGPIRISSPIARNLNSGDKIYLVVANADTARQLDLLYVVRYAITLQ